MPRIQQLVPPQTGKPPLHSLPLTIHEVGHGHHRVVAPSKGKYKFLLVGIDYFTKWVEAEPLTAITAKNVENFVWENIIWQFDLPQVIITDNSRQFIDRGLAEFYEKLDIKHITNSVEHPQINGQAEAANKVILNELRKRLSPAKGKWTEELLEVLWAYRYTPQSTIQETPFSLTYMTEVMVLVEVGKPSLQRQMLDMNPQQRKLVGQP